MPRRQSTRIAAAALAALLFAAAAPRLALAITGTGSDQAETGGPEPAATNPPPNSPTSPMAVTPTGAPGGGDSSAPTIGGDAPKVVGFRSKADDLTPDDGNGHPDAFVNDNGVLTRVSTDPPGATVTDVVAGPSLSSTGDVVTYGAKLREGERDVAVPRVVVVNRRTGMTELAPLPRPGRRPGDADLPGPRWRRGRRRQHRPGHHPRLHQGRVHLVGHQPRTRRHQRHRRRVRPRPDHGHDHRRLAGGRAQRAGL